MATRVGRRVIDGRPVWFVAWESPDGRRRLFWYAHSREQADVAHRRLRDWEAGQRESTDPGEAIVAD